MAGWIMDLAYLSMSNIQRATRNKSGFLVAWKVLIKVTPMLKIILNSIRTGIKGVY